MILQWLSLQYLSKSFSVPFPKLNAFLIFSLHQTEYPPSCIASLIELYGRPDRPPLKLYHNVFVFYGNIYLSLQGFILPSIGVSEWSIAHILKYIWHVPGPLLVFPVWWVLSRRTCITVWRPL